MGPKHQGAYAAAGVDYDPIDEFKREAAAVAASTYGNLSGADGFRVLEWSQGESVQAFDMDGSNYLGVVMEGLGTKNGVADEMYVVTNGARSYYDHIAQDTVAMPVNDLVTLGFRSITVPMFIAAGESGWYADKKRRREYLSGWKSAVTQARSAWIGGESQALPGFGLGLHSVLACPSVGYVRKEKILNPANIRHGDAIVIIAAKGIHANGLSLARKIRKLLGDDGYLTKLPDGRTYGETLLDPTPIYAGIVLDCLSADVKLSYTVNITGHGLKKLMRAPGEFGYIIDSLPPVLPIFKFMREYLKEMDDEEAYSTLNMGSGFALYMPERELPKFWKVMDLPEHQHHSVYMAGHVEKTKRKFVSLKPLGIKYTELGIR